MKRNIGIALCAILLAVVICGCAASHANDRTDIRENSVADNDKQNNMQPLESIDQDEEPLEQKPDNVGGSSKPEPDKQPEPPEQQLDPPVSKGEPQQIGFDVQRIDTDAGMNKPGITETGVVVVRTEEDLSIFYEKYMDVIDPQFDYLKEDFKNKTAMYDGDFFTNHSLVLITNIESASSMKQEMKQVVKNADGNYAVYMERIIPEINSADVERFHILVTVDGCIAEDAKVTLEINNIYESNE